MSAGRTLVLLAVGTVIPLVAPSWRRHVDAGAGHDEPPVIAEHRATESHYNAADR
jgi:hypothetical protein